MVKLIASDLDGTLLLFGAKAVSEQALDFISKLNDYGVVFAAASGRQYPNLERLFSSVRGEIAYICENGALVKYKDKTLLKKPLERKLGVEIIKDICAREQCEVLISGEEVSYLLPKTESYVDHLKYHVGNQVKIIRDLDEIEEDFLKISAYEKRGIDFSSDYFMDKWADVTKATVSGECWIDFVAQGVNKGAAIQKIQEVIHTTKDDTMCFGDSYNDLDMFQNALYSYAMTSANSEIRASARYVTTTVESVLYDVYQVLSR